MRKPAQLTLFFVMALLSSCARSLEPVATMTSGSVSVVLAAEGGGLKSGTNAVELRFQSGSPQPIEAPSLLLYMPAMGTMPEMRSNASLRPSDSPGVYQGTMNLEMKGTWQGLVEFTVGPERRREMFSIQVE